MMANWQRYPESLSPALCSPYIFNTNYLSQHLHESAKHLFVSSAQLHIKIIELGSREFVITDFKSLDEYLSQPAFIGTRIFLIPQAFSWDHLKISVDGIKRLFHYLDVFPVALDVLWAFDRQNSAISDSLGCCHSYTKGDISEYCYVTKIAEEHGREGADEPWSIRQIGVYHRKDAGAEKNDFVLFNPTINFQRRLKDAQAQTGALPSPLDIHTLLLSHSTWQWRSYLSFWETRLEKLTAKAYLSQANNLTDVNASATLKIEYGDVQDVQVIHNRMNTTKFVLGSNRRICECFHELGAGLFLSEFNQQFARAENLLEKSKSVSGLMQDILSYGGLDALRLGNVIAEKDNKIMVDLTSKSHKDAQILKKITILTMIYLPASFVSQFLSMGYLKVNSTSHPPSLNLASELWVFAVLTITLFVITLGLWLFLDWPSRWRKRYRLRKDSKNQAADEKV